MAYGLKYHFAITAHSGGTCVLDIEKKDYSGSVIDLGGLLQGISLEKQGDNLVEEAITKSALTFTLVDRDGGMWEEFFTPDATMFKVTLSLGGRTMWMGYVTPDSFTESLVYRGSVAITARDMIGHLADIPFNEADFLDVDNHLLSVDSFLSQAMLKSECPMSVNLSSGTHYLVSDKGISVKDWLVDLRAFEGQNLYEAVEAILDSTGMCMRWEDGKGVAVTSIRDAGRLSGGRQNIVFYSQSGTRSLDPAYRMTDEVFNLEYAEGEQTEWDGLFNANDRLNGQGGWSQADGRKNVIASRGSEAGFFGDMPESEAGLYSMLYCVPKESGQGTIATKTMLIGADTPVSLSFEVAHTFDSSKNALDTEENYSGGHKIPYSDLVAHELEGRGHLPSGRLRYVVRWRGYNGTYAYLTPTGWSNQSYILEESFHPHIVRYTQQYDQLWCPDSVRTISLSFTTPSNAGELDLLVYPFEHQFRLSVTPTTTIYDTHTYWVRFGNVSIVPEASSFPKDIKTKVVYDESQNYTLKREPKLGICPDGLNYAGLCINAFYQQEYTAIEAVKDVSFGTGASLPLPVYVALQHITMHSRPVSVVGGTIGVGDDEQIDLAGRWNWGGLDLYLCGGSFDPINGVVNGAILRETPSWQDISADYTLKGGNKDLQMQSIREAISSSSKTITSEGGGGTGIEDAPRDGRTYGRKDGSWVSVESQGGGVEWGEESTQAVTLDVNGVSKQLSKSGHTHSGYVDTSSVQEISGNKTFTGETDLADPYKGTGESKSPLVSEEEMDGRLTGKQDTIADLADIRSGASKGATAIQPVTLVEALSFKADKNDVYTKGQVDAMLDSVELTDDGEGTGAVIVHHGDGTFSSIEVSTPDHNHDAEYFSKSAGESLDTLVGQTIEDIGNLVDDNENIHNSLTNIDGSIADLQTDKADKTEVYTKTESDGRYERKAQGDGYVTLDSEQTITGNKTFQGDVLFDGRISAGGNSIEDVVDPTNPTDVANKAYVDAHMGSGAEWQQETGAGSKIYPLKVGNVTHNVSTEGHTHDGYVTLGTEQTITGDKHFDGVVDLMGNNIINVTDPTDPLDSANKAYVDRAITMLTTHLSQLEDRVYALEHAEQFVKLFLTSRYELSTYQYPRKFPNPNDGCIINCMTWNGYLYDGHPLNYRVVADDAVTINSNSYNSMAYRLGIPIRVEVGARYKVKWEYEDAEGNGTVDSKINPVFVDASGEILDGDNYKYIEEGEGIVTIPQECAWLILCLEGTGFVGDPALAYPMNWYDMKVQKL